MHLPPRPPLDWQHDARSSCAHPSIHAAFDWESERLQCRPQLCGSCVADLHFFVTCDAWLSYESEECACLHVLAGSARVRIIGQEQAGR